MSPNDVNRLLKYGSSHPGAVSHVERALSIARSLGPTTDPLAVKIHAGCEALLTELYSRLGRTTESRAAADRGFAILATRGCMDIAALLCALTTYYSRELIDIGRLDEAMEALARAKVASSLPPGTKPLYETELCLLVSTEGSVFQRMEKTPG